AIAAHEPPSTSAQEVVGDGAFQAALIALMGFAAAGASAPAKPLPTGTHPPALDAHGTRRTVRKALRRLHRKIGKEAKGFAALPAETRHGVRKRIKRLRYLTEFFAPALQGRGRKFLRRLEPAQDALGRLNDEQVAEGLYRKMARRDPQAWFAVGWL
ncbi:CHAD domain-containing protein, partial [Pantoea sp. 18059]|uniref:CHAD domain-containing protein n=1 Tax=Pantoea sp. 18059 TaxID=2681407 RepID=UPI0013308E23